MEEEGDWEPNFNVQELNTLLHTRWIGERTEDYVSLEQPGLEYPNRGTLWHAVRFFMDAIAEGRLLLSTICNLKFKYDANRFFDCLIIHLRKAPACTTISPIKLQNHQETIWLGFKNHVFAFVQDWSGLPTVNVQMTALYIKGVPCIPVLYSHEGPEIFSPPRDPMQLSIRPPRVSKATTGWEPSWPEEQQERIAEALAHTWTSHRVGRDGCVPFHLEYPAVRTPGDLLFVARTYFELLHAGDIIDNVTRGLCFQPEEGALGVHSLVGAPGAQEFSKNTIAFVHKDVGFQVRGHTDAEGLVHLYFSAGEGYVFM